MPRSGRKKSNHIHLLIKEGEEDLEIVFRRIGAKYVYWYNWNYRRRGHLFQDRYKSEAVEDDSYLLTVIRYLTVKSSETLRSL